MSSSGLYYDGQVFRQSDGPAIWGGCVTRRKRRAGSRYPEYSGPESCHGARRVWRTFCRPGTSFVSYTRVAVQV
jgi:hypothetical protein